MKYIVATFAVQLLLVARKNRTKLRRICSLNRNRNSCTLLLSYDKYTVRLFVGAISHVRSHVIHFACNVD